MNKPILSPLAGASRDSRLSLAREMRDVVGLRAQAVPVLTEYWRAVMQRKWLVLAIAAGIVVPAAVVTKLSSPIFEASTMLLVHQGKNRVVSIEEVVAGNSGNREFLLTQAELIKSRNVADRVIDKLRLADHPDFDPRRESALSSLLNRLGGSSPSQGAASGSAADASDAAIREEVFRRFQRKLDVQLVRLSQLVRVSFESTDPALAAAVANAVADAYIQADLDARYSMTVKANSWLNDQASKLRESLQVSERALQEFRERKGLVDRQTTSQSGQGRQFESLQQRLVEARLRRSQADQALAQLRAGGAMGNESLPAVLADPVVTKAREARGIANQKLAEVSERVGPSHPLYLAAKAEVAAAERSVKTAVDSVTSAIVRESETARALEESVQRSLATLQRSIQTYNRDEFEVGVYEREVNTNRQLLETFMARAKETSVSADLQSAAAMVMDAAVPPTRAVKPRMAQTLQLAGAAGLLLGIMAAVFRHRSYAALGTVESAETRLGHPVLSAAPKIAKADLKHAAEMVTFRPDSAFSESIRSIRTALLLSSVDAPHTTIAFTSSVPGEGKSTISFNVALAMAQSVQTLFIECDMRRPSIVGARRPGGGPGLAEVLADRANFADCVFQPTNSTLDVLAAGTVPSNPLEMLSSKRFETLLKALSARYEMIILDTPPTAAVSDAVIVAAHATSIVFVVKADSTPHQLANRALERLRTAGTEVIGTVLNAMDFRKAEKYYGEYSGYGGDAYHEAYKSAAAPRRK